MKKLLAFLLAAMLLLGLFTTAQAAAFEVYHHAITSLDSYSGYTASDWFSTAGNRAYVAAALYGETKDIFRSVVGSPAKIYIGKGLMNDNATEFLVLDYFNSAGKFYTVTFYPNGTPQDPYAHAFYNDMSSLSTSYVVNKYYPYYTITASAFSTAYSQWTSDSQSGGGGTKAFENYYHAITSLDSYSGYTASEWISTPDNRAYAAAALYGETKEIFRKTVGNPTQVYVGKGLMNDNATEFLVLDFFNSSGKKFYTVTFYPAGTPKDPYAHAFYSDLSMMSSSYVASNYKPYYTISGDAFAKAYGKWKSEDHSGGSGDSTATFDVYSHAINSLKKYGYSTSEWFSTSANRAYVAAALYGETKDVFRKAVGNPTKVLIGKGLMSDNSTEIVVAEYYDTAGKYCTATFYPNGTPREKYPYAIYTDLRSNYTSMVMDYYKPYYSISASDFASAYSRWKSEDHSGDTGGDDTYLFNFIGNRSSRTISFTLPARGYIELKINKSGSMSYAGDRGFYDILISRNGENIMTIDSFRYRKDTTEKYIIGLDGGSYDIQFKPGGYSTYDTVNNSITGTFTPDLYYEIETNNTMEQATELHPDIVYTGYFGEEDDDNEYYSFYAEEGKQYQIRFPDMAALKRTTAILRLVNSSGHEDVMSLSQTTDYFYYDFTPEQTGTYYIRIFNYKGGTYGVVRYQVGVFGGYAEALPGDVNDDGIVDGRDVLRLMKYLAGEEEDEETGEPLEINFDNADVDGSGSINEKDLLRLMRYLGGEDVKLLPGAMYGNG